MARQCVHEYESWNIGAALREGPRTAAEILEHLQSGPCRHGLQLPGEHRGLGRRRRILEHVTAALGEWVRRGWVVRQGERYALTERGREEALRPQADVESKPALPQTLVQPQTASKISLAVYLGLAAVKLPAGILSGSAGLINDAADTLLDGFSSILVYLGLRFDRERAVNIVLVLIMLGTGLLTLYEAGRRLLTGSRLEMDALAILAALLSGLACAGLAAYQRHVGLHSGSLLLITQAVDSRNHVIIAAGVVGGLIASALHFPLMDGLVGLAVGLLILKSAVDLGMGLLRPAEEEAPAAAPRSQAGAVDWHEHFRRTQLRDWMLYLVGEQGVRSRSELLARAHRAAGFAHPRMLRAPGPDQPSQPETMGEEALAELVELGWLTGEEHLGLTPAGREVLAQWTKGPRRGMYRLGAGRGRRRRGVYTDS